MIPFSGVRVRIAPDGTRTVRVDGRADRETDTPWRADTLTQIGSISKQFLAATALLLAADGAVALDATLGDTLPAVPPQHTATTLQQLLTHTAGIPHWQGAPGVSPEVRVDADERLERILAAPRVDRWTYSSPGYLLAAAMLEHATGRPYANLVRSLVIDRLALTRTEVGRATGSGGARGYRGSEPIEPWPLEDMPGTGDVLSCADDVARFVLALHTGGLLPSASQSRFADTVVPVATGDDGSPFTVTGYGLGHFAGRLGERPVVLHPGDNPGFHALAAWAGDTREVVVALGNDEADDIDSAAAELLAPGGR